MIVKLTEKYCQFSTDWRFAMIYGEKSEKAIEKGWLIRSNSGVAMDLEEEFIIEFTPNHL